VAGALRLLTRDREKGIPLLRPFSGGYCQFPIRKKAAAI